MDTSALRRADRTVGLAATALLTLIRRTGRDRRVAPPERPSRMVIIKLAEQGSTVLAYPALRQCTEMVGRDNVFVVVFAPNRAVLDELDVVPAANVLTIRTDSSRTVVDDVARVVRRLRSEGIDTAVDMEFFSRSSAVLAYLSGASIRVGLHSFHGEGAWRGDLLTHRVSHNPRLHASEWFRALVEATRRPPSGLPAMPPLDRSPDGLPGLRPTEAERRRVAGLVRSALAAAGDATEDVLPPLVVLNPNAGDLLPLRRWPPDRYVDLAEQLLASDPDLAVVLTGSSEEARAVGEIAAEIDSPRAVSVAGRTSLRELLVLHDLSEVLVTNDSGPAHYAALTGVDVITLFGPESPDVFGSRSDRAHNVWAGLPCSPCVNAFNDRRSACADNLCMQAIGTPHVADLVLETLAARADRV